MFIVLNQQTEVNENLVDIDLILLGIDLIFVPIIGHFTEKLYFHEN